MLIRPYAASDLPRLHEIRLAAFRPVFESFRQILGPGISRVALATAEDEQAAYLKDLCTGATGRHVLVAILDDQPVGFSAITCDAMSRVGELALNAVDPEHQGKGIGTRLYDESLDLMRSEGMAIATVGTGGDARHAAARRAYEKAGFTAGLPTIWLYRTL